MFKKITFAALLLISAYGAFAQKTVEYSVLMNNPANSAGSANTPDTTRAATAYYFEIAKPLHNAERVTIHCYTKKDSGTVAGNAFIEGSLDPVTPGSSKTWVTLVSAAGDSLAIGDGNASRFWQYNANTTVKPDFDYYRAKVNITAISRSRVKCYLKAYLKQ